MKTLTTTNKTGGICYCSVARTPLRGLVLLLDRSVLWDDPPIGPPSTGLTPAAKGAIRGPATKHWQAT